MIVMKFGGSSVADADRIRKVTEIVRERLDRKPIVVSSAFKGVTDGLLEAAAEAEKGNKPDMAPIRRRHRRILGDLDLDPKLHDDLLEELAVLLRGISLVRELTPRTLDTVVSFGERLSTRVLAAHFTRGGIPAEQHDAYEIGFLTDDTFGSAQPLPEAEASLKDSIGRMKTLPVITGFLGRTPAGEITTIGRNGSDLTATYIGAAIGAEEVQIWSDVDGVMTADPRIVPKARLIEQLSFAEASELAYYGGKVLHPASIVPAVRKKIPVRCLNSFNPAQSGTSILADVPAPERGVRSIAHNLHNLILTISSPRMFQGHGFLARIFDVFGRHRISIDLVSTSEVTVSVTVDSSRNLEDAVENLRAFAEVTIERGKAIICVVGDGMRSRQGIVGEVFQALKAAGSNVLMISQGASKINIAFVVDDAECQTAVQALHERFFGA